MGAVVSHTQIYLQLTVLWERCCRLKEIIVGVRAQHGSKCDVPSSESERTEQQRLFINGQETGIYQTLACLMADGMHANRSHGRDNNHIS